MLDGLSSGFLTFAVGTLGGAAMAIGSAIVRSWIEVRQREQDRLDHYVKRVRLADQSARLAVADNRDPGAAVRRWLVFMVVFFGIAFPAIAMLLGKTTSFEHEISHPDGFLGLWRAYTERVWVTVRGYAVPIYLSDSVLGVFGFYFGHGAVSRQFRS